MSETAIREGEARASRMGHLIAFEGLTETHMNSHGGRSDVATAHSRQQYALVTTALLLATIG
jgi:hypothetical protein